MTSVLRAARSPAGTQLRKLTCVLLVSKLQWHNKYFNIQYMQMKDSESWEVNNVKTQQGKKSLGQGEVRNLLSHVRKSEARLQRDTSDAGGEHGPGCWPTQFCPLSVQSPAVLL